MALHLIALALIHPIRTAVTWATALSACGGAVLALHLTEERT